MIKSRDEGEGLSQHQSCWKGGLSACETVRVQYIANGARATEKQRIARRYLQAIGNEVSDRLLSN